MQLTFNRTNFQPINKANQIWLTASQLAEALEYSDVRSVTKIYQRNADEFTSSMTEVVKLTTTNNNVNLQTSTRIFSLRGCHLIAMFARTAIAKEFRKWVLDVLDKEIGEPVQIRLTSDDTLPLRNAVNIATGVLKLDYSTIYKMVHQRFGINEIKDLSKDEVGQAVEYIHSLMLQCGKKSDNDIITHNVHNLVWHTMYIYKWYRGVEEAFYKLSPQISSCVHDHIMEAKGNANRLYQLMNFDFNKDCPRRLG